MAHGGICCFVFEDSHILAHQNEHDALWNSSEFQTHPKDGRILDHQNECDALSNASEFQKQP